MMMTLGFPSPMSVPWEAVPPPATVAGGPLAPAVEPGGEPDDTLARLVRLVASNDRLLNELKRLDARLAEADDYLAKPDANFALGCAYRDRVRTRRSRVLALLRANRVEAREFLAD